MSNYRAGAAGQVWSFWKTVQTVSPKAIEDEALAGFRLALIGTPEDRAALRAALLTEKVTVLEQEEAENHLREYDETPEPDSARSFTFLIYTAGPNEPIGVRGSNSVPAVAKNPAELVETLLALRPDLTVALARRFPLARVPACNFLINSTAKVNASIAVISALPGILPITGIILPVSSMADVVLLTKNQFVLIMRLAAAYGQKPAYTKQVKELFGTIASALGWRTLAREVVGLVPAGIGVALKGAIAYSGTIALGKSALWFYQTGKTPTKEAIQAAYKESEAEAKVEVEKITKDVEKDSENDKPDKSEPE
jgi:uncharacterized protein (DUF697 family)